MYPSQSQIRVDDQHKKNLHLNNLEEEKAQDYQDPMHYYTEMENTTQVKLKK